MFKVAKGAGRSSRTINTHLDDHNKDVGRYKGCSRCQKAKSVHAKEMIAIPRRRRK